MAISLVAVGGKIAAAVMNLVIAGVNGIGDRAVVPTSVSGTGVSVGSNGVVTLSGVTGAAVINGCFTSSYSSYRIEFDMTYSAAGIPTMQLCVAGTPVATNTYDQQRSGTGAGSAVADQVIAGPSWNLSLSATTMTGKIVSTLKVYDPAVAVATYGRVDTFGAPNPMTAATTSSTGTRGLLQRGLTAFDGFTILASGTVSGTIRIYGINDN